MRTEQTIPVHTMYTLTFIDSSRTRMQQGDMCSAVGSTGMAICSCRCGYHVSATQDPATLSVVRMDSHMHCSGASLPQHHKPEFISTPHRVPRPRARGSPMHALGPRCLQHLLCTTQLIIWHYSLLSISPNPDPNRRSSDIWTRPHPNL